ncbi:MAG: class I SAM-dependent methyltransferase [Acidobacteria bacterium]|nr:class I SAM-dependent methyltransferase [Acidobacteriota bacterium]
MEYLNIYYPESRFGGFTDVDGTILFYTRVKALVEPSSVVLDVGCGRGMYEEDSVAVRKESRTLKGRCAKVIGIDVDISGEDNPGIDEFRRIEGQQWPLDDGSVDVIVSDCVLEHVEDPESFFSESRRALKTGGVLCIRTANARSYVGLISRIVPNNLHAKVLKKAKHCKKEEDTFPTVYKCNTRRKVASMLDRHGFDNCVYECESEPYYLSFSRFFFYLGVLHQRFAFRVFKPAIFAFGRKS